MDPKDLKRCAKKYRRTQNHDLNTLVHLYSSLEKDPTDQLKQEISQLETAIRTRAQSYQVSDAQPPPKRTRQAGFRDNCYDVLGMCDKLTLLIKENKLSQSIRLYRKIQKLIENITWAYPRINAGKKIIHTKHKYYGIRYKCGCDTEGMGRDCMFHTNYSGLKSFSKATTSFEPFTKMHQFNPSIVALHAVAYPKC